MQTRPSEYMEMQSPQWSSTTSVIYLALLRSSQEDDDDVDGRFLAMFVESNAGNEVEAACADHQSYSGETIECTNAREITRG